MALIHITHQLNESGRIENDSSILTISVIKRRGFIFPIIMAKCENYTVKRFINQK